MHAAARLGVLLAAAVLIAALLALGRLERSVPFVDLELEGGVPARLYVPGERDRDADLPPPPAHGKRLPGIVLAHGFAGDRAMMSTLARRLAGAGHAVLAVDLRGHGANRNPLGAGRRSDQFDPEFAAAIEYLRASPHVDGLRLAVMGHSMGAHAALDYATRDPGLDATVLISGGFVMEGPHRPPNALFVYAEGDSAHLRRASDRLAATLLEHVEGGGDPATGSAVRVVELPGLDHVTILYAQAAAREIVAWLDASFGRVERPPLRLADPRLPTAAVAGLAWLVVLVGLGTAAGRLAPAWLEGAPLPSGRAFAAFLASLLAALPFASTDSLGGVLALEIASEVVSFALAAGLLVLGGLALTGRLGVSRMVARAPRSLAIAAATVLVVALVQTPLGVVFHGLVLTPERGVQALLSSAGLLPLFLALELLLRRGTPARACAQAVAGKLLVVAALFGGVLAGWLPGVLGIMLPLLAPALLMMELVAVPVYALSRNLLVIALIEAGWLGWLQAALMPTNW